MINVPIFESIHTDYFFLESQDGWVKISQINSVKLFKGQMNKKDAERKCNSAKGKLLEITSEKESKGLTKALRKLTWSSAWIGMVNMLGTFNEIMGTNYMFGQMYF